MKTIGGLWKLRHRGGPLVTWVQYRRCAACHYSPTGGGLLTPYGRLLSHRELSTTGGTATAPAGGDEDAPRGEQAFLYGALGSALGPVHLGLELRPSHLRIGFPGGSTSMNFVMNADLIGAMQKKGWTAYGSIGRLPGLGRVPAQSDATAISYEHWVGYTTENGFGIRAGRFLPAYGIRFSDHTAYSRIYLDLDRNDQVYGLEVSDTMGPSLLQVTVSRRQGRSDPARQGSSWSFDRGSVAARRHIAQRHRRLRVLSTCDRSRSQVRSVWRCVRLCAFLARHGVDRGRREPADGGARRPHLGGGE